VSQRFLGKDSADGILEKIGRISVSQPQQTLFQFYILIDGKFNKKKSIQKKLFALFLHFFYNALIIINIDNVFYKFKRLCTDRFQRGQN